MPMEIITNKIYLIRRQKVMLSPHLSELYGVETKSPPKITNQFVLFA